MQPMQLNAQLTLEEVSCSKLFADTRLVLTELEKRQGAPTTEKGNLTRTVVRELFDKMSMEEETRRKVLEMNKVINEPDYGPIHKARVLLELGGLLQRRRKQFKVTREGRALVASEQAGALYHTLFITQFCKLNLSYHFPVREVPAIQTSMAVILWRLNMVARNWIPMKGIAEQLLFPDVHEKLRQASSQYVTQEYVLYGLALEPLVEMALLEVRDSGSVSWSVPWEGEIRVSPLWSRFISFREIQILSAPPFHQN